MENITIKKLENYSDVLTIDEVAEILRIGRSTAYGMAKRNEFPGIIRMSTGIIRVLKSEFIKDLEKRMVA